MNRFLIAASLFAVLAPAPLALAGPADTRLADAAMRHDASAVRALMAQGVDVNAPGKDGTPPLHWVIRVDDVDLTGALLRGGADPKRPNRYGVTPLGLACTNGDAAMIGLLLDAGADPNAADPTGETALMTAAGVGDLESVKTLLVHGATVDAIDPGFQQTALMYAVRANHPAIVRLLIDHGASVNARTRVGPTPAWVLPNSVPGFGHGIGIVRGGWPDRGSRGPIPGAMSPLLYAARDGRLELVRILVDAGADLNQVEANRISPLLMAITNAHVDVARFLIDPDGSRSAPRQADIHLVDWYGRTALWAAIEARNMDLDSATFENDIDRAPFLDLIQLLLDRGADSNTRIEQVPPIRRQMLHITGDLSWVDFTGQTPFLKAALSADVAVMRLLLEYGADPYIDTYGGTTALMAAAGINRVVDQTYTGGPQAQLEAVKLCWELGMDAVAVNSMGLTAVHGAANRGSDDIITFLVEKGARLDVKDKEGRTPLTWAEGVFLATHPARPKPTSMALIKKLMADSTVAQQ